MKVFVTSIMIAGLVSMGHVAKAAPVPADDMQCAQAVAYYEKHERIYIVAHNKNIVPIYGMKPISKARSLRCRGRSAGKAFYGVNTKDNDACIIAIYCR